ncbi:uncharacterized protein [Argopecten irradians]|uniref:uncharacterized protein n=1 Tax=Argopecten irradians TaxID=31199 RepID=UPI00371D1275
MPTNEHFTLSVRVGDTTLPEYNKDGVHYVESNLFTPFSYKQEYTEVIQGEHEKQKWPVTPFTIAVRGNPATPHSYYRVYVDGQVVKKMSVPPGKTRLVSGFRDRNNCLEFLFSLPRFCHGESDKLATDLMSRVGLIEVECYNAEKKASFVTRRKRNLEFDQANKNDCLGVTQGQYLMATTKVGKVIKKRSTNKMTDHWSLHGLRSRQSVKYVTAQTLVDHGFSIIPIPFPANSGTDLDQKTNVKQETTVLQMKQEIPSPSKTLSVASDTRVKFLI